MLTKNRVEIKICGNIFERNNLFVRIEHFWDLGAVGSLVVRALD